MKQGRWRVAGVSQHFIDCVFSIFQYIQKLNRQERVVEEVKHVLKPHFLRKYITKEDYKEIMKKSVSKVSVLCETRKT